MSTFRGFIAIDINTTPDISDFKGEIEKTKADVKLVETQNIHITYIQYMTGAQMTSGLLMIVLVSSTTNCMTFFTGQVCQLEKCVLHLLL